MAQPLLAVRYAPILRMGCFVRARYDLSRPGRDRALSAPFQPVTQIPPSLNHPPLAAISVRRV